MRQTIAVILLLTVISCSKPVANNNGNGNRTDTTAIVPIVPPFTAKIDTITSTGFTASWSSVPGADKYFLYVATDSNFSQSLTGYNPLTVTDTSSLVTNLTATNKYYFRVRANVNGVPGNYSNAIPVITAAKQWVISLFAGSLTTSGYHDGQGTNALFSFLGAMTVDAADNIYVIDQQETRIRKITPLGAVSTYAGNGVPGTVDGSALAAQIQAMGIAYEPLSGNLFFSDFGGYIRKVTPSGSVVTVAGNPVVEGLVDGQGSAAYLNDPSVITADGLGNIYFYEQEGDYSYGEVPDAIRKVSSSGYVSTIKANLNYAPGSVGGITYYNGALYFTTGFSFQVLKLTTTGILSVVTGVNNSTDMTGSFINGNTSVARFGYLDGICVDATGNLYVFDQGFAVVRKISTSNIVSTFAGTPPLISPDGEFVGPALTTMLESYGSTSMVIDSKGNIYISENNTCILKISYQ